MVTRICLIIFLLGVSILGLRAQSTFKAHLTAGINAGQIDGDFEVGFNKIGATGGVGIGINLTEKIFLSTEFLYSSRGSKNAIFKKDANENGSIHLNYLELPITVRLKDWYQEEDEYYKVWLEAGFSGGRLINGEIRGSDVPEIAEEFNTTDISFILGAGLNITKRLFTQFRYTRSFTPVYKAENPGVGDVEKFLSYFLTLRIGYTL